MITLKDIEIRKDEVQLEINALQNEMVDLETTFRVVQEIENTKNPREGVLSGKKTTLVEVTNLTQSIPDMIFSVLSKNLEGLTVVELLEEIHKSYDPEMSRQNLASTLTRMKKKNDLIKSGSKMWALKKETSDADTSDVLKSLAEVTASSKDSQGLESLAEPLVPKGDHQQKGDGNGP